MLRSILGRRLLALLSPDPAPAGTPPIPPPAPAVVVDPPAGDEPPAPAAGDEPPAPESDEPLYLHSLMMKDMLPKPAATEEIEPAPEPTTPPVTDPNAPATPPAAATPPGTPVPPDTTPATPPATPAPAAPAKTKVRSVAKNHPVLATPPPNFTPAPPPAAIPDGGLTDEQREEMEEARVAERLFPERYQGQTQRLKAWYEKTAGVDLDNEDNRQLAEAKPSIQATDYKRVARTIVKESAAADVQRAIAPKINNLEREQYKAKIMPEVKQFKENDFPVQIAQLIQSDPNSPMAAALKVAIEKGGEEAAKEYPAEFEIMRETTQRNQHLVEAFLLTSKQAEPWNDNNPVHKALGEFIRDEGQQFVRTGGAYLVRGGRQFLPRAEFIAKMNSDQAERATVDAANWRSSKYWTFDDAGILNMMAIRTKQQAEKALKFELEKAERRGFVRAPKTPVAAAQPTPAAPVAEVHPPRARASAAPAPTGKPPKKPTNDVSPIPVSSLAADMRASFKLNK